MLVAAAICPHPPLLIPEVGAGAAGELDEVRAACAAAVRALVAAEPDRLVVVGGGMQTRLHPPGTVGSLAGFGVPYAVALPGDGAVPTVALPGDREAHAVVLPFAEAVPAVGLPADGVAPAVAATPDAEPRLPLSLTVGAWLLTTHAPAARAVEGLEVGADSTPAQCRALGAGLAGADDRLALLVMADGSARRGPGAPGYLDPRAAEFDDEVARAVAHADTAALLAVDPDLATGLLAAGRAALQVLAGAAAQRPSLPDGVRDRPLARAEPYGGPNPSQPDGVRDRPVARAERFGVLSAPEPAEVRGRLFARTDPYGVDYLVATWMRH